MTIPDCFTPHPNQNYELTGTATAAATTTINEIKEENINKSTINTNINKNINTNINSNTNTNNSNNNENLTIHSYEDQNNDYDDQDSNNSNNEENEENEESLKNGLLESNSLFNTYRFSKNMCDGGGFVLNRLIGSKELDMIDPFLLLDEINTNSPQEYENGFPDHPHCGIQLVSYIIEGEMAHTDSLGNKELLKRGDLQWILSGKGIIHSEMPVLEPRTTDMLDDNNNNSNNNNNQPKLLVIHYWLNLPKQYKMINPDYQHVYSDQVPTIQYNNKENTTSFLIKVISGDYDLQQRQYKSPLKSIGIVPQVLDIDIKLLSSSNHDHNVNSTTTTHPFEIELNEEHNSFLLVLSGSIFINQSLCPIEQGKFIVFNNSTNSIKKTVSIISNSNCRVLFFSSKPIKETVVKFGPFAMSSIAEIHQCFIDFQYGI